MKKIILLFVLTISMYAATQYKIPNFVVQNSELYCATLNGVSVHPVGDIISGEKSLWCAYDKSVAELKVQQKIKINDEVNDRNTIVLCCCIFLGLLIFATPFLIFIPYKK